MAIFESLSAFELRSTAGQPLYVSKGKELALTAVSISPHGNLVAAHQLSAGNFEQYSIGLHSSGRGRYAWVGYVQSPDDLRYIREILGVHLPELETRGLLFAVTLLDNGSVENFSPLYYGAKMEIVDYELEYPSVASQISDSGELIIAAVLNTPISIPSKGSSHVVGPDFLDRIFGLQYVCLMRFDSDFRFLSADTILAAKNIGFPTIAEIGSNTFLVAAPFGRSLRARLQEDFFNESGLENAVAISEVTFSIKN